MLSYLVRLASFILIYNFAYFHMIYTILKDLRLIKYISRWSKLVLLSLLKYNDVKLSYDELISKLGVKLN